MKMRLFALLLFAILLLPGCAPKLKIFAAPTTEPLKEFVVEGEGDGKLALIHLSGFLVDQPSQGLLRPVPSQVQELTSALRLAEQDEEVKAVVVAVNSPVERPRHPISSIMNFWLSRNAPARRSWPPCLMWPRPADTTPPCLPTGFWHTLPR